MNTKTPTSILSLISTLLAAGACSSADPDAAPDYAARGPFAVGHRHFEAPGALRIKSWYPALGNPAAGEEITYSITLKYAPWNGLSPATVRGQAIADAPLDGGASRPLVVFSHGYVLNPEWYAGLVEHLASRGFIVLAPEHAEDDWLGAAEASFNRPSDVKATLDFAETLASPQGAWPGQIDLRNVAVVGHSYGGYTALAAAGARFDLGPFNARCAALAADAPETFLCSPFLGKEADMAARAGLAAVPDGLWPTTMGDPRVTAVVTMAGDAYLMNQAGLAQITVPIMALGGTADFGTPFDWGAKLTYEHASSRTKSLVAFEGADHMIFANPCETMPFTSQLSDLERQFVCLDAAPWERQRAQRWIRHLSTAFLRDALGGDARARAALAPGAVAEEGLGYVTTYR